jgi:hypothetical protein
MSEPSLTDSITSILSSSLERPDVDKDIYPAITGQKVYDPNVAYLRPKPWKAAMLNLMERRSEPEFLTRNQSILQRSCCS